MGVNMLLCEDGGLKTASVTIETALLMPVILLVIFSIISLDLYMISRVTCESAACEQAVSGKAFEDLFVPGSAPAVRAENDSESVRQVTFSSETAAVYGRFRWPVEASASYKKVYPVKGIRQSRAAAGPVRNFTGK